MLHFIVMVMPRSELQIYVSYLERNFALYVRETIACLGPRSSGLEGTGVAVRQLL